VANVHIRPGWQLPEREVTPEGLWVNRREFVKKAGSGALVAAATLACGDGDGNGLGAVPDGHGPLDNIPDTPTANLYPEAPNDPRFTPGDRHNVVNPELDAASYNNFYEFGTDHGNVWRHVIPFEARPWSLTVSGLVDNPGTYDLVDLERRFQLQERIYRHRCVERWSVVIPWIGFPLRELLDYVGVQNLATHIAYITFHRPEQAVGQRTQTWYTWPYYEGLRIDEAYNDLAFVATGMYGHPLQKQNGAPIRLHMPWKYGYKSSKSIVELVVTDEQPRTFWNDLQPGEYGFYSNIDPDTPHPRWSQAEERIIGGDGWIPTLPFNGYGEYVADLYGGYVTPPGDVPHAN